MSRSWKQFLIYRLPAVILFLGVIVEALAALLQGTPQLRHPLDYLLISMKQAEISNSGVVILGDSVTQDTANQYRLASKARLADLTTNQASGMTGSYILLRRHMKKNGSPRHVIIAATPEFFAYTPTAATAKVYLSSVFTDADEQRYLSSVGLLPDIQEWRPAVLEIEDRVFNKLTSFIFPNSPSEKYKKPSPPGNPTLEGLGGNATSIIAIKPRFRSQLKLSKTAQRALQDICRLITPQNATLHIVVAPIPASVYRYWKVDKRLESFEVNVRAAANKNCQKIIVSDFNKTRSFPDHAFRDSDHLRRPGWTALYAHMLKQYIARLY